MSFTGLLHALDPMAGPIAVNASVFGDAVEVLGLAAAAAARRFGPRPPWQFASAASGGLLLGPVSITVSVVEGDQHELTLGTPRTGGQSPLVDHVRGH